MNVSDLQWHHASCVPFYCGFRLFIYVYISYVSRSYHKNVTHFTVVVVIFIHRHRRLSLLTKSLKFSCVFISLHPFFLSSIKSIIQFHFFFLLKKHTHALKDCVKIENILFVFLFLSFDLALEVNKKTVESAYFWQHFYNVYILRHRSKSHYS